MPSPSGSYLFTRLIRIVPEHSMTLEEATPLLRSVLVEEAKISAMDDWLEAKRDELDVKIFPEVLNLLSEGEAGAGIS